MATVALVDAAVKDGHVAAKGRDSWLGTAVDFAKGRSTPQFIVRQSVSSQVQTGGKLETVQL